MKIIELYVVAIIALTLASCSLISVNTCSKDEDTSGFVDVQGVSDYPACQSMCEGKNRNAYGALLYSPTKDPQFNCSCGPVR